MFSKKKWLLVLAALLTGGFMLPGILEALAKEEVNSKTLKEIKQEGFLRCGVRNNTIAGSGPYDNESTNEADFMTSGFQHQGYLYCKGLGAALEVDVEYVKLQVRDVFEAVRTGSKTTFIRADGAEINGVDAAYRVMNRQAGRDILNDVEYVDAMIYDKETFFWHPSVDLDPATSFAELVTFFGAFLDSHICTNLAGFAQNTRLRGLLGLPATGPVDQLIELEDPNSGFPTLCLAIYTNEILITASPIVKPDDGLFSNNWAFVAEGDKDWWNINYYFMNGLKGAAAAGLTRANVDSETPAPDTEGAFILGQANPDGDSVGDLLGLDPDFMRRAISVVGNYDEIFLSAFGVPTTAINKGFASLRPVMQPEGP